PASDGTAPAGARPVQVQLPVPGAEQPPDRPDRRGPAGAGYPGVTGRLRSTGPCRRPNTEKNETAGEPIPGGGRCAEGGYFFSGKIIGSSPRSFSTSLSVKAPLRKDWAFFTDLSRYKTTVMSDSFGRV